MDTLGSLSAQRIGEHQPGSANGKGQRRRIQGVAVDLVDYATVIETIHRWRQQGHQKYVTLANPHTVLLCHRDPEMRAATEQAGMTLPDGIGLTFTATILGYRHRGRVTGPSLMLALCDWGRQHSYRHFFYGGADGVPQRVAERLSAMFPGLIVAGTYSPPFRPQTPQESAETAARIADTKPDILWVGLGAPKQEKWMLANVGKVDVPVMISVGAAFDFHSGNAKWAPAWMRKLGLEWVHRLVREPRRMWPRAIDGVFFLLNVVAYRFGSRPSA
jgi:N-acetylglucosaminyldiphosphoundecaprenol N-acetyl-beta-D-mannosaminyltransferase